MPDRPGYSTELCAAEHFLASGRLGGMAEAWARHVVDADPGPVRGFAAIDRARRRGSAADHADAIARFGDYHRARQARRSLAEMQGGEAELVRMFEDQRDDLADLVARDPYNTTRLMKLRDVEETLDEIARAALMEPLGERMRQGGSGRLMHHVTPGVPHHLPGMRPSLDMLAEILIWQRDYTRAQEGPLREWRISEAEILEAAERYGGYTPDFLEARAWSLTEDDGYPFDPRVHATILTYLEDAAIFSNHEFERVFSCFGFADTAARTFDMELRALRERGLPTDEMAGHVERMSCAAVRGARLLGQQCGAGRGRAWMCEQVPRAFEELSERGRCTDLLHADEDQIGLDPPSKPVPDSAL